MNSHFGSKFVVLCALSRAFGRSVPRYLKPRIGSSERNGIYRASGTTYSRVLFVAILLIFGDAGANEHQRPNETETVPFESLSEQQQHVLTPMREQWEGLSGQRQRRLMKGADRWSAMDEAERQKAREKMQRWRNLSPEKKQRMLKRLQRFRSMSPERRQRLRRTFQSFKQLPEDERRALREKWRNASPTERRELRREMMEKQRTAQ